MVGLVIVSHSAALADGVVELAREMGGEEVAIESAGGLEDGAIGTDAARVVEAVERARSDDGVLVLMDLGSALMSAEMAAEMVAPEGGPVVLCSAPLVEGAVAAAARARGGASIEEVAREARGALGMKTSQLGEQAADVGAGAGAVGEAGGAAPRGAAADDAIGGETLKLRLRLEPRLGLHARPAARFVAAVSDFDATVAVRNATRSTGPADGRSLTALAILNARQGDEIVVSARGPQASEALDALRALAAENFGDAREAPGTDDVEAATPGRLAAETAAAKPGQPGSEPATGAAGEPAAETAAAKPGQPGSEPATGAAGEPAAAGAPESAPAPAADGADAPGQLASAAPAAGTRLAGVAASSGIAIGPVRRLHAADPPVDDRPAGPSADERARLDAARAAVRHELEAARASLQARGADAEAEIFSAHALLLDDAALTEPAQRGIDEGASAGQAWRAAAQEAAAAFRALDDPYLRERAVDVEDVGRRVLAQLAGTQAGSAPRGPGVIVAVELTPGEAAGLDPDTAWGIATARGGATAHAAILARALGIPAVVGIGDALLALPEGTPLVLDGDAGTVDVDPGEEVLADRKARRDAAAAERRAMLARAAEPGELRDGRRIEVVANVGGPEEARRAVEQGAEGVGLLRTEFLFLDRATPPDEDEQVAVLCDIARALDGRPLVVRTLDAGADKPLPFLRQDPEDNPFLGRRGIRLSLAEPDLFATQLRAILRVAEEHPVKVMFPMVATLDELLDARAALDRARAALGGKADPEIGVMVEVPALALQAAQVAPHVDFFSIGTNDLAQYTMAAERGNAALAGLLERSLPSVLALIAQVCAAAEAHGCWVGVCGELAGDPHAAVLLAGVGVSELSMAASRIAAVKEALRATDSESAAAAARSALESGAENRSSSPAAR